MSQSDLEKLEKIQHILTFEDGLYCTDREDVVDGIAEDTDINDVIFRLDHTKELKMIEEIIKNYTGEADPEQIRGE